MTLQRTFGLVVLTALLTTGCSAAEGPPAKAPLPELPRDVEMPSEPAAPGKTRVVLDSDVKQGEVVEVLERVDVAEHGRVAGYVAERRGSAERKKSVCVAPCAVDLDRGVHHLRFPGYDGDVALQVGEKPRLVRHASGVLDEGSPVGQVVARTLLVVGGSLALTGALLYGLSASRSSSTFSTGGSLGLALGGLAGVAVSIPLFAFSRPVTHASATVDVPLEVAKR